MTTSGFCSIDYKELLLQIDMDELSKVSDNVIG